jgi:hypothetical protein
MEAEHDEPSEGLWEPTLGEKVAGRICIGRWLPAPERWAVYWHELLHAINDITAWDRDQALTT